MFSQLWQHGSKNLETQILFVSKLIGAPLDDADLVRSSQRISYRADLDGVGAFESAETLFFIVRLHLDAEIAAVGTERNGVGPGTMRDH